MMCGPARSPAARWPEQQPRPAPTTPSSAPSRRGQAWPSVTRAPAPGPPRPPQCPARAACQSTTRAAGGAPTSLPTALPRRSCCSARSTALAGGTQACQRRMQQAAWRHTRPVGHVSRPAGRLGACMRPAQLGQSQGAGSPRTSIHDGVVGGGRDRLCQPTCDAGALHQCCLLPACTYESRRSCCVHVCFAGVCVLRVRTRVGVVPGALVVQAAGLFGARGVGMDGQ